MTLSASGFRSLLTPGSRPLSSSFRSLLTPRKKAAEAIEVKYDFTKERKAALQAPRRLQDIMEKASKRRARGGGGRGGG